MVCSFQIEIIKTGDASSISLTMTVAQMASASAWASVGLLINDAFVMVSTKVWVAY